MATSVACFRGRRQEEEEKLNRKPKSEQIRLIAKSMRGGRLAESKPSQSRASRETTGGGNGAAPTSHTMLQKPSQHRGSPSSKGDGVIHQAGEASFHRRNSLHSKDAAIKTHSLCGKQPQTMLWSSFIRCTRCSNSSKSSSMQEQCNNKWFTNKCYGMELPFTQRVKVLGSEDNDK